MSDDPTLGFQDPAAARALAESMIDDVGVIYVAAGGSGTGVADVLRERLRASPDERVFLIGSDVDHSARHGNITLGSVLKRFDVSVRNAILDAVVGTFLSR